MVIEMKTQPVNTKLNTIVACALQAEINRCGLKLEFTSEGVPSTGKAIHAMWEVSKREGLPFKVFNGANDARNLYFSESVNLCYRAVHDVDHAIAYEIGRGTTKYEDELYLNCLMARRVYLHAIKNNDSLTALHAFFAMYHDTVGQVKFYKEHGTFLVNQRAHTIGLMNECKGVHYVTTGQVRLAYQVMIGYMVECGL